MLRREDGYEEICCGISWLRALSFGGAGVAGTDRLHGFAGEPYGGAGTGGRCGCAVLGGAVAAQLVPAVNLKFEARTLGNESAVCLFCLKSQLFGKDAWAVTLPQTPFFGRF